MQRSSERTGSRKAGVIRIGLILAGMMGVSFLGGCGNDVEMPTPYHLGYLDQPRNVEVSREGDVVRVSWEMESTANVAGFVVRFTDASGRIESRFVGDPSATSYEDRSLDLSPGTVYIVQVWAVDEREFFGPTSGADSLVVD